MRRQQALDTAYEAHPERFVRGRPIVALPPERVHINLPLPTETTSAETPVDAPSTETALQAAAE